MVALGLSPRVRGNLCGVDIHRTIQRSIPACTGEPSGQPDLHPVPKVYPRVYGGTEPWLKRVVQTFGLSPRVRGNPISSMRRGDANRSIPACTGEPKHASQTASH